jgi:hypothetical protein
MPRSKPALGKKRPRAKKSPGPAIPRGWEACPPRTVDELIRDMHEPLNEAAALTQALRLMALGMTELGRDEGVAVLAVADAASDRIKTVDDTWLDFIQVVRR